MFTQDEVLAISDKVVIRADDLLTWIDHGQTWQWGLRAATVKPTAAVATTITTPISKKDKSGDGCCEEANDNDKEDAQHHVPTLKNTQLDFTDVNIEKGECGVYIMYIHICTNNNRDVDGREGGGQFVSLFSICRSQSLAGLSRSR